jgi:hypothetical protein
MPFTLLDMDAAEWLTIPRFTITRVERIEAEGRQQARVHFEVCTRFGQLEHRSLRDEDPLALVAGWFTLDPDNAWAIVEYETQTMSPQLRAPLANHAMATYGAKRDGAPVLTSVRKTGSQPYWRSVTDVDIRRTQFGPVPELALRDSGASVPHLPSQDHVLARAMHECLSGAERTAAAIGLLVAVQIAASLWRRSRPRKT